MISGGSSPINSTARLCSSFIASSGCGGVNAGTPGFAINCQFGKVHYIITLNIPLFSYAISVSVFPKTFV